MSDPVSVINKLLLALQNIRFYPLSHSLVQASLAGLYELLQARLAGKTEFSFGFIEKKLMVDGQPAVGEAAQTDTLARHFEMLQIDSLTFRRELTLPELQAFLECLALKPEDVSNAGGLQKILTERNLVHIQADSVTYRRVKKGEEKREEKGKRITTSAAEDFIKALRGTKGRTVSGTGPDGGGGGEESFQPSRAELKELYALRANFQTELERRVNESIRHYDTENKRLTFEKNRMDAIIKNVGEGVVVVGNDGNILMANPAAEKLLGKHGQAVVGQALKNTLQAEHALVLAQGTMESIKEIEVAGKDDETRRVLRASNAVVEDLNGQAIGMVSVLSDITKMKEVEQLKSDFVANVSHELRSPLVAMQKNLAILMDQTAGAVNGHQKEFLALTRENLDRLTRMINDLLDLSKIEAGKMELKKVRTDLAGLVRKTAANFSGWFREKSITLRLDLPETPLLLDLDADKITQVLNNLLSNALKFTPEKGLIAVAVKTSGPVEVSVTDTGIGIPAKDLHRIFNKFEQVSSDKPVGAAGTGLGLPLAREMIEKHGGQIMVRSEVGKGSTFTFSLPN